MSNKIIVLYDGHCRLCRGSVRFLQRLDWFNLLAYKDFQDEHVRHNIAPSVTFDTLDKAMHIKTTDGTFLSGFYAFRHMMWRLPVLSLLTPLLYAPGVPLIGRHVYSYIAAQRKDCNHETCAY